MGTIDSEPLRTMQNCIARLIEVPALTDRSTPFGYFLPTENAKVLI